MVKDPICKMNVEIDQAVPLEWRGTVYYFCSEECRETFKENPMQYLEVEEEKNH